MIETARTADSGVKEDEYEAMLGGEDEDLQRSFAKSTAWREERKNATREGPSCDEGVNGLNACSGDALMQPGRADGEGTDAWCGTEESICEDRCSLNATGGAESNDDHQNSGSLQRVLTESVEVEVLDRGPETSRGMDGANSHRSILKVKTVAESRQAKLVKPMALGGKKVKFDVKPGEGPGERFGGRVMAGLLRLSRRRAEFGKMDVESEEVTDGPGKGTSLERQSSVTIKLDAEGAAGGPVWSDSYMNLMNLKEMADAFMEEEAEEPLAAERPGHARKSSLDMYETKQEADVATDVWSKPRGVPDHVKNPSKYTCYTLEWSEEDEEKQNRAALEAVTRVTQTEESQHPPPESGGRDAEDGEGGGGAQAPDVRNGSIPFVAPKKGAEASAWSAARRGRSKSQQRITLDGSTDFLATFQAEWLVLADSLPSMSSRGSGGGVSLWAEEASEQERGEGGGEMEVSPEWVGGGSGSGLKKGGVRSGRQYRNRRPEGGVGPDTESTVELQG